MNFFESDEKLERELNNFSASQRPHLAPVSPDVPLISNLSISGNIALIRQYHQNLPWDKAKAMSHDLLSRFDLMGIAEKRNPSLTQDERFIVMLLRAATVPEAILVLDRPFRILTAHRDGRFLAEALRKIEDLIATAHIFDYIWQKERYRIIDDAEN